MSTRTTEEQLRRFLLVLSAAICVGTVLELVLVGHVEETVQYVPFVLSGLGLGMVMLALYTPGRRVFLALRGVMATVALGSIFGVYQHFEHNLAFELEMDAKASVGDVLWEAFSGASPFLAPGILAVAAVTAIAATYKHPALVKKVDDGQKAAHLQ